MRKYTKSGAKKQAILQDRIKLEEALSQEKYAASTQKVYLRAFDTFAACLDQKVPATATLKEAKRHLTELKQVGASTSVTGNASATLRFYFETVRDIKWKPISALQKRMVEDMDLSGFASRTQDSYVRSVSLLTRYYQRSPELLSDEELRAYFVHLTSERKLARSTITIALSGIKFFYEKTLKRDWSLTGVPVPKRNKFLPVILSRKEARLIISKVQNVRHIACLSLIYACGLRLSEGCMVKVTDIDRDRMQLHVRGKGSKDRYVALPSAVMPQLAACWRDHRNPVWLFPFVGRGGRYGAITNRHVPQSTVQQAFRQAYLESGVTKKVTIHSLRHAYATHLLEAGVSLRQIQKWLGHSSAAMTAHYAQLTSQSTEVSGKILEELMSGIGSHCA